MIPASPKVCVSEIEALVASCEQEVQAQTERDASLNCILSCLDLTSLQGSDTQQKIESLCQKAMQPGRDIALPSVAAVCVFAPLIKKAKDVLAKSEVKVASVSAYFPSGMAPLHLKIEETRYVLSQGADEVDIVISRGILLEGREQEVFEEIAEIKKICGNRCLKVILETGELGSFDMIRRASDIALYAGADFIKTSTGKSEPGATLPAAAVMLQALADFQKLTGRRVGFKAAGGVSTPKQALAYYGLTRRVLGEEALNPGYFRIGASRLVDEIVAELSPS